jgi:polyhydroxyalkanoate synthase subunit PhaC
MTLAHLAGIGELDRISALTLTVTVLDQAEAGLAAAMADERVAKAAIAASAARGYLDGSSLAEVFAWLRPNDLIWNYWINNYLQGRKPAPFDVLFWNADTTRMAAALHRGFVQAGLSNAVPGPRVSAGQPYPLVFRLGLPGPHRVQDHHDHNRNRRRDPTIQRRHHE